MTVAFAAAALAFLTMMFAAPATRWLYLGYICFHAFAMAGVNSGALNLIYDYVAPEDRSVALGVKNALGGVFAFLAALLSGRLLDAIQANGGFSFFGVTLYAQQVQSALSLVGTLFLILYMRVLVAPLHRVKE